MFGAAGGMDDLGGALQCILYLGVECTAPSPLRPKTDIETSDSLERRHEGRAFIQHGQNRVSGLGRKHQDDPINAGVTIAF
jgi:hypothetical protein